MNKLLFTESAMPLVLEAFGKSINEDGFIIESETGEFVFTTHGETIQSHELGGFSRDGFFKNDLFSIMELVELQKEKEKSITNN